MLSCFPVQILVVVAIILLRQSHRRLKRSRFPCEQYLDMGESVLTPEEIFLGKVPKKHTLFTEGVFFCETVGEREFGPKFRNRFVGN